MNAAIASGVEGSFRWFPVDRAIPPVLKDADITRSGAKRD
jgi:hypothetical protein